MSWGEANNKPALGGIQNLVVYQQPNIQEFKDKELFVDTNGHRHLLKDLIDVSIKDDKSHIARMNDSTLIPISENMYVKLKCYLDMKTLFDTRSNNVF